MNGSSMSPYITDGNLLIYYRLDKDYVIGDVVLVKQDNNYNIYRISGTNGDKISIEDGTLLINGFREEIQGFYDTEIPEDSKVTYPCVIGENEYFVTNDFRLDLNDSRSFGVINKKDIVGRVIAKLQIRGI
jgi:signal peptidase I